MTTASRSSRHARFRGIRPNLAILISLPPPLRLQTADEVIPKVLLVWLSDHELIARSRSENTAGKNGTLDNGYFQEARRLIATSLWNLAKKRDNSLKLAMQVHFDSLLERLDDDYEQDVVIRRVLPTIQLIVANPQCLRHLVLDAHTRPNGKAEDARRDAHQRHWLERLSSDESNDSARVMLVQRAPTEHLPLATGFPLLLKLSRILHAGHKPNERLPADSPKYCKRGLMHQRVLGTLANLAQLAATTAPNSLRAGGMLETDKPAQDKLKQYLNTFLRNMSGTDEDLRGAFSLEKMEQTDPQLKNLPVRFEAARFLWCMVRMGICYGQSVRVAGAMGVRARRESRSSLSNVTRCGN